MSSKIANSINQPLVCTTEEDAFDDLDVKLSLSWLRIAIAAVFAGQSMVFSLAINMTPPEFGTISYWVLHACLIFSVFIVICFLGGPLFVSTFAMIRSKRLSIEGLFTLSLVGAFVGSLVSTFTNQGAVFYEVVSIVIAIYTVGHMLGERSQTRLHMESEKIRERFDSALLQEGDRLHMKPVSEIELGRIVHVYPGQPFTMDGIVRTGVGYVRETALTGDPLPVVRHVGDRVRAGTWSEDGAFEIEVCRVAGDRELDVILQTVEDVKGCPSEIQTQANRLMRFFLPVVAGLSMVTAIYWSLVASWMEAVLNSMAVLLVACPCALGLATPVAIWQGLFHLSQMGLVSRDGALIDALARTKKIYFDKTGTLSESAMRIVELVVVDDWQERRAELLAAVQAVESKFKHPIARAVADYLEPGQVEVAELRAIPGQGVLARAGDFMLSIGEPSLQKEVSVSRACDQLKEAGGKRVFIFADGMLAAVIVLREQLRLGVPTVLESLQALGIRAEVLTGDSKSEVKLPVKINAGLSAAGKRDIIRNSRDRGVFPVFVGDGINDASAMACASASIAMGSGATLTCSTANGQLVSDRIEALPEAIRLARFIRRRLQANLIYAAAYNVLGMGLAATGYLHPVAAALIMLISSFWVTVRVLKKC